MSEVSPANSNVTANAPEGLITLPTAQELAVAQSAREAREATEREALRVWQSAEKKRTWKSRMKKVMAATALLATVKSGGFIDMAADPFSDAGDVAARAVDVAPVTVPDEMDGIAFGDYDKAVQTEYIADETARVEQQAAAKNVIVDLFDRADGEGYDGIVAEVAADKQAHPELYVPVEAVDRTRESIDSAETNADAVDALDDFMGSYGITAKFYDQPFENRSGDLKEILNGYIDVFSVLPKDFIAMSKLTEVTVSDEALTHNPETVGTEAGSYSPNSNSINIVVPHKVIDLLAVGSGHIDRDDYSYQSVIAHELGHAFNEQKILSSYLDEDELVDATGSFNLPHRIELAARSFINVPDYVSVYGRTESSENSAEVAAGVLSDRSNGLARVEETRRFDSAANKSMIDMLAQLEEIRPGIAKILIANRITDL